MKKQIILVINGKGGVGKSFLAVNLVQFFKDRGLTVLPFDTDNENSTLKHFHPDAIFINIADPKSLDILISKLDTNSLLVMDCRAASTDIFLNYFDELGLFELLKQMKTALTIVSPINHDADSVKQLQVLSDRLGNRCNYIIARNHSFSGKFTIYEESQTRAHLFKDLRASEIEMPKLYDWLVVALNQAGCTITAALQSPRFSIMDRQRLKHWQRIFYDHLDSVKKFLSPELAKAKDHTGD